MINSHLKINLMENVDLPLCDSRDGKHGPWIEKVRPANNRSGWHEDECVVCGVIKCYDTSD